MSFNYLDTPFSEISDVQVSKIDIYDELAYSTILEALYKSHYQNKYLHIIITNWNRDYPLPPLPNNIIILEIRGDYKFPLDNLPSTIEVLVLNYKYKYPLVNLPINLYQLEFDLLSYLVSSTMSKYSLQLDMIPESVKILKIRETINQSSYNLPLGLKYLEFSSNTFTDEVVSYPKTLEYVYMYNNEPMSADKIAKLDMYFNLANLPISLKTLFLPNYTISNMDNIKNIKNIENILERLINLEELHIPNSSIPQISIYPPNLVKLYIYTLTYKLVNLPASLKYLYIPWYNDSLEAIAASNIEHLDLDDTNDISIIHYIPKSLKKITLIETHREISKIRKQYPHLEIIKLIDNDYQQRLIDVMRCEM